MMIAHCGIVTFNGEQDIVWMFTIARSGEYG
jgi:hypothetical protein